MKSLSQIPKNAFFLFSKKSGLSLISVGGQQAKEEKKRTDIHRDIDTFVSTMVGSPAFSGPTTKKAHLMPMDIRTKTFPSPNKPSLSPTSVGDQQAKKEKKRAGIHGVIESFKPMTENPALKIKTKSTSKIFKKVIFLSPVKTGLSLTSVGADKAKKEKKRADSHGDINTFVSTMIASPASPRSMTQTTKKTTQLSRPQTFSLLPSQAYYPCQ